MGLRYTCDCYGSVKKQGNVIFPLGEISSNPDPDAIHKTDHKGLVCHIQSLLSVFCNTNIVMIGFSQFIHITCLKIQESCYYKHNIQEWNKYIRNDDR